MFEPKVVDFLIFCLSFVCSNLLVFSLNPFLKARLLDQPNSRSSHLQPTPRGGGVVFVLVASLASVAFLLLSSSFSSLQLVVVTAPLLALPLALVGLADDFNDLPASWRYGVQFATALVVVLTSPFTSLSFYSLLFIAFLVVAVTAVINFVNFMDGVDGLVSGCMFVAITSAAIQLVAPWPTWALLGSLFGFLLWNWSPAKVFMGDVGSTFLGAVFVFLVFQASSWPEALALLLVATPVLGDACFCVPRRLLTGQQVFQAHRLHLFQRLHQAGWTHARVATLYISATVLLAFASLLGGLTWVVTFALVEILIGFWLDQYVAIPFSRTSYD